MRHIIIIIIIIIISLHFTFFPSEVLFSSLYLHLVVIIVRIRVITDTITITANTEHIADSGACLKRSCTSKGDRSNKHYNTKYAKIYG